MIEIKFYASNTKYLKSMSVWILNWVLGLGRPIVVWTFYQVLNTVKSIEIKNILNVATKHLEYLAPSWQDLNVFVFWQQELQTLDYSSTTLQNNSLSFTAVFAFYLNPVFVYCWTKWADACPMSCILMMLIDKNWHLQRTRESASFNA